MGECLSPKHNDQCAKHLNVEDVLGLFSDNRWGSLLSVDGTVNTEKHAEAVKKKVKRNLKSLNVSVQKATKIFNQQKCVHILDWSRNSGDFDPIAN